MSSLSLFTGHAFSAGLAVQLAFGLLAGTYFLSWTLFMQDGLGLAPGQPPSAFVAASRGDRRLARHEPRARYGWAVPQAGALLAAVALSGCYQFISTEGFGMGTVRARF